MASETQHLVGGTCPKEGVRFTAPLGQSKPPFPALRRLRSRPKEGANPGSRNGCEIHSSLRAAKPPFDRPKGAAKETASLGQSAAASGEGGLAALRAAPFSWWLMVVRRFRGGWRRFRGGWRRFRGGWRRFRGG